jgi:hypothetical protein
LGPEIPAEQKPILEAALNKQHELLVQQGFGNALREFLGGQPIAPDLPTNFRHVPQKTDAGVTYQSMLPKYIQAKREQVTRLNVRLLGMIQACNQIAGTPDPGRFSLPVTKQAWQTNQAKVQMRLKSLNARLEAVRGIEEGMGVLRPKIEELAVRKMRTEHPMLAVEWDAACEQARRNIFTKGDRPIGDKRSVAVKH